MADPLEEYRRKRDSARTPEPVPAADERPSGRGDTFVIQQHHATSLHWDLRLERDGVLVSWAVPRGVPRDPKRNHLAVHTEDHPMEYAAFHGEIPAGEYGGGRMTIYDTGTYETEKWRDDEVMVVLHGDRVDGRYVLYRTNGRDWMIHRMGSPPAGWTPMPERIEPMRPQRADALPGDDDAWAYEMAWAGLRAFGYVSGGRLRLVDAAGGAEIGRGYPELRELAETLAPTECVLDGVIVALDAAGRISRDALQPRLTTDQRAAARRAALKVPVQFLIVDLLWLDGEPTGDLPYRRRRELLDGLGLAGSYWQTPPYFAGGGTFALAASQEQGLPGIVAKRLDSIYRGGVQGDDDWKLIA
ncbi:MAG: bifunctional non-ous end joining protein LigD [Micromonosporaceae bacterium]|nr:bifunctional non-ous end joining protein LigD [Micromonosporaceae bacterium]